MFLLVLPVFSKAEEQFLVGSPCPDSQETPDLASFSAPLVKARLGQLTSGYSPGGGIVPRSSEDKSWPDRWPAHLPAHVP